MSSIDISVVIPVYNEQEIIEHVVKDWDITLKEYTRNYEIHIYNDGSKDKTLEVLRSVISKYRHLKIHNKPNSGHGSTILQGYRENHHAEWIFQVDSDNEIPAQYFRKFWELKSDYDFIVGIRQQRNGPFVRKIISFIAKSVVSLFYGRSIKDVNVPYRLMRNQKFKPIFAKIPGSTFAPNVIISGCAVQKKLKIKQIPVSSTLRETGEVSIKKWKLFRVTVTSLWQTIRFRFYMNQNEKVFHT